MTELRYFKKQKDAEKELSEEVLQIKVDEIRPNRAQPRASFEQNSIIRLADSIRRYGILQPLTVRLSDPEDSCKYELIAGERRLRAARMLGYLTVPCIVKEADDKVSAELAIIENLLREDLNMFEEAYGYKKLIENHHLTQEDVAKKMSVSQSAVANKLRLLKLSFEEQKLILNSGLTERHARTLIRLEDPDKRKTALKSIIDNKFNVSAAECYVDNILSSSSQQAQSPSASTKREAESTEKLSEDTLRIIRKQVDNWSSHGKSANINISNSPDAIEISIKLCK